MRKRRVILLIVGILLGSCGALTALFPGSAPVNVSIVFLRRTNDATGASVGIFQLRNNGSNVVRQTGSHLFQMGRPNLAAISFLTPWTLSALAQPGEAVIFSLPLHTPVTPPWRLGESVAAVGVRSRLGEWLSMKGWGAPIARGLPDAAWGPPPTIVWSDWIDP
jgi:hypothetical protein